MKITKTKIIGFLITMFILGSIIFLIYQSEKYTENRYDLSELDENVYAIYYTTYSNVPAHNYEVVTLCVNNNVYTYKGDVSISYTEDKPYAIIKEYNMVNEDKVHIYVPLNTVIYEKGVSIRWKQVIQHNLKSHSREDDSLVK